MGAAKELWFAMMEDRFAQYLDEGMDEEAAYEKATDQAFHDQADRMADLADRARDEAKERGR